MSMAYKYIRNRGENRKCNYDIFINVYVLIMYVIGFEILIVLLRCKLSLISTNLSIIIYTCVIFCFDELARIGLCGPDPAVEW